MSGLDVSTPKGSMCTEITEFCTGSRIFKGFSSADLQHKDKPNSDPGELQALLFWTLIPGLNLY